VKNKRYKRKWNLIRFNCIICGKFYWIFKCRIKTAKTCSPKCQLKYLHQCNDKKIYVICAFCGKKKKVYPARLTAFSNRKNFFCDFNCMAAFRLGSNNPAWNGGGSFEPYPVEFNEKLKYKIRQRDNFTCQIIECGIKENGKAHAVHHIDYDKNNCRDENLITLCISCNTKVNYNRQEWKNLLQEICAI